MGIIIYSVLGLFGVVGWFMYINYFMRVKHIAAPYMQVKRSKGKKILLLVDTGTDSFEMVAAEKEALSALAIFAIRPPAVPSRRKRSRSMSIRRTVFAWRTTAT